MKNILLFFVFQLCITHVSAQESALRAYLETKQFYAPGTGNYLEIYFQFAGHSLKYKYSNAGIICEVSVVLEILSNDSIIRSDEYILQSPLVKDSIVEDFFDLRRYALPPGSYMLRIRMKDLNDDKKEIHASQEVAIEELGKKVTFSEIEAIEYGRKEERVSPFHKSGYYLLPRLSTYFSEELNSIPVYLELYNSTFLDDSICGIKQSIMNIDTGEELPEFTVYNKIRIDEVVPIIRNVDITDVPSGKFSLNFTLISRNLEEICNKTYTFERTNDREISWNSEQMILDPAFQSSITNDSTSFYLESLIPISKPAEVKNIVSTLKKHNQEAERKHIQAFWMQSAPGNSYDAWMKYKLQVQRIEKLYANNFQEGFETDRGRVYLQYGAPTTIVARETSPSEYPYEIWQYNKIGKFSNKRFIFYNPDLVNNAYILLHSDMIGELKNPSWQQILSKRNTSNGNVDDPNSNMMDHWGGQSNDLFRQY
jgi:GWxTD domain-containing protein